MKKAIQELRQQAVNDFQAVASTAEVEALRVKYLGKKGPLQLLMQQLKEVSPEERPAFGKEVNDLKNEMAMLCEHALAKLTLSEEAKKLAEEWIDITLPGRRRFAGRQHPLTALMDEILNILMEMGFSVQQGPIIESDYYNFEALNMNKDHPARDMQDTFYITPDVLLRTHTSGIQVRVMEKTTPPVRIICPGRVYRNEAVSARSHVFFHQVEGLYVDKGVTFSDLFSTMDEFWRRLFRHEVATRYRPSYFPFVEPGVEVDVECMACRAKGCPLCKKTGWLEVAGAGMVHPEVLKNGGIDPEEYTGFAWGMGIDRLLLLRHAIPDIRLLTENDMRFLAQFTHV